MANSSTSFLAEKLQLPGMNPLSCGNVVGELVPLIRLRGQGITDLLKAEPAILQKTDLFGVFFLILGNDTFEFFLCGLSGQFKPVLGFVLKRFVDHRIGYPLLLQFLTDPALTMAFVDVLTDLAFGVTQIIEKLVLKTEKDGRLNLFIAKALI